MNYLVDTNVLLRWVQRRAPEHPMARGAIKILRGRGDQLVVTPQNLVELWSVATRPVAVNGVGKDPSWAERMAVRIERAFPLLPDIPAIHAEWRRLVALTGARGRQVHDARIAAVMRAHGVGHILTFNGGDFARYPGVVAVDPASLAAGP